MHNKELRGLSTFLLNKLMNQKAWKGICHEAHLERWFEPKVFKANLLEYMENSYIQLYRQTNISTYDFNLVCNGGVLETVSVPGHQSANVLPFHLAFIDGLSRKRGAELSVSDLSFLRVQFDPPTVNDQDTDDDFDEQVHQSFNDSDNDDDDSSSDDKVSQREEHTNSNGKTAQSLDTKKRKKQKTNTIHIRQDYT
jgi:hypothetical protein